MAIRERYHVGGFIPDAPASNLAEAWDDANGTYTSWDTNGNVLITRLLTAAESAEFVASPLTSDEKIAAAVVALNALDSIAAPVLPIDVLDILTDVRTALEG